VTQAGLAGRLGAAVDVGHYVAYRSDVRVTLEPAQRRAQRYRCGQGAMHCSVGGDQAVHRSVHQSGLDDGGGERDGSARVRVDDGPRPVAGVVVGHPAEVDHLEVGAPEGQPVQCKERVVARADPAGERSDERLREEHVA